jgi:hypothetical protein
MSENTALAVPKRQLTPAAWDMLQALGTAAYESRRFGLSKREGEVKMAVAWEFGLPVTTALSSVYVIENKPVLAPKLLWALVQAHPDFESYEETRLEEDGTFAGWSIAIKRKAMPQIERSFTMEQARSIVVNSEGLTLAEKNNWRNYPEDTCYWRALDRVMHVAFADVCMGLYAADELGMDVGPDGDIVEGEWNVVEERDDALTLERLIAQYGADAILTANDGVIPGEPEDVARVARILRNEEEA